MKKLVIVDKSAEPYKHLSEIVEVEHQRDVPKYSLNGTDLLAVAFPGSVWNPTNPYGRLERAAEVAQRKEIPLFIISPHYQSIPEEFDFIGVKDPEELYKKVRDSLG